MTPEEIRAAARVHIERRSRPRSQRWPPDMARDLVARFRRDVTGAEDLADPRTRDLVERAVARAETGDVGTVITLLLDGPLRDVETSASEQVMGLDTSHHPVVDHVRSGALNADSGLSAADLTTYLVRFHDQLPIFASELSKIVSWAVPRSTRDGADRAGSEGEWSFRFSVPDVTRRIDEVPEITDWFADVVISFAVDGIVGLNARRHLPDDYRRLAEDRETALVYFVLAHEYSHIAFGHITQEPRGEDVPELERRRFDWEEELEADGLGLILALDALSYRQRIPVERAFLGSTLFLEALDVLDHAVALLHTGDENALQVGSHPPSAMRSDRLREVLRQTDDATDGRSARTTENALGLDDIQSATLRLLWERIRPIVAEMHRMGVIPTGGWSSIPREVPTVRGWQAERGTGLIENFEQDGEEAPPYFLNEQANALGKAGDVDGAQALYRRAIASGNADIAPQATLNLALSLDDGGDPTAAAELYRSAITGGHPRVVPAARFRLGLIERDRGHPEEAATLLASAADSTDDDIAPRAALVLGQLREKHGASDEARDLFARAVDSGHRPAAAQAMFALGSLQLRAGETDPALATFRRAAAADEPTAAAAAACIVADLLVGLGDSAAARPFYEQAAESGGAETVPLARFQLAELLRRAGDREGARRQYSLAAASGHRTYAPKATSALAALAEDGGDRAQRRDRAATADRPSPSPAEMFNLAAGLEDEGDAAGARELYRRVAAAGDPTASPTAWYNLGKQYERSGDQSQARTAYREALAYSAPHVVPLAALSLGILLHGDADLDSARPYFEQAIASEHPDAAPRAMCSLGMLLDLQGDDEGAREAFERAVASGHQAVVPTARERLARIPATPPVPPPEPPGRRRWWRRSAQ